MVNRARELIHHKKLDNLAQFELMYSFAPLIVEVERLDRFSDVVVVDRTGRELVICDHG